MRQTTPNLYQLSGHHLHVTFSTSGIDGKPHLTYQDAHHSLSFAGDQIRVVECDVGNLVSVSLSRTVDSGSTSFSLLVPRVVLSDTAPQHLHTHGITTVHRFSIVPALNVGQDDSYTVTALHGTAHAVVF